MKITLILDPWNAPETDIRLSGTVLTLNDVDYDLSEVPDGATASHSALRKVFRSGDDYEVTIRLGHGPNAPLETRFPEPIVLDNHSGPIELPLYDVAPDQGEIPDELA